MRATEYTIGRIPALDGIRGLAISLVLCWHVVFRSLRGNVPNHHYLSRILEMGRFSWSGVDLFFVLSGFLIGGILLDTANSPSYFSTFYIRRAYRILPLYTVVLVLTLVLDIHFARGHLVEMFYYPFFLQNLLMAATGSFGKVHLDITWSLAVEEQFYLTLPFIVRSIPPRILWRVLVGTILAAPLVRILCINFHHQGWIAAYVLMPCRADALCLGVLIAMAARNESVWAKIVAHRKILYTAFLFVSLVGLRTLLGGFQPFTTQLLGLEYSLLAAIYAFLLLSTLVSSRLALLFSCDTLRFMGIIAYGVYLFHSLTNFLFQKALFHLRPESGAMATSLIAATAALVSVGLATLSWKYFEKPLVKRGHRHQYWTNIKASPPVPPNYSL